MTERATSTRFPYLRVRIDFPDRPELPEVVTDAFVDTGFDGEIILPIHYLNELGEPDGRDKWQLADGSEIEANFFWARLEFVGLTRSIPVVISLLGSETLIGRFVTDKFRLVLDHGERISIEP